MHITVHQVLDRNGYRQLGSIMFRGVDREGLIEPERDARDDKDEEEGEHNGTRRERANGPRASPGSLVRNCCIPGRPSLRRSW